MPRPSHVAERFLRFGYVARGLLYGAMALVAATLADAGLGAWGEFLLGALGVGFGGYGLWRLLLAAQNPASEGLAARGGYTVAGLVYLVLSFETFALLVSGGTGDGTLTRTVLAHPAGPGVVRAGALAVITVGVAQFGEAAREHVSSRLRQPSDPRHREVLRVLGGMGLAARAVSYWVIGALLLLAATRPPGEILDRLRDALLGPWLLFATAAGFLVYAGYCVAQGTYRQVPG